MSLCVQLIMSEGPSSPDRLFKLLLKGISGCSSSSSKKFMDSFPRSSSAFLFDVDLFICVRLQVLQAVRLPVHDLIGGFHEPGKRHRCKVKSLIIC